MNVPVNQGEVPAAASTREAPINILIVDDEPKNLTVLESLLDEPGYRLVRAGSADEALLALVMEEFALLILDVRMPGMTGFELAQMIKGRKKTARVPIIFLSAYYNEDQHVLEGYGSGAVDYLHKPVNATILRSKVAVFAELHRKGREVAESNRALMAEVAERRHAEEQLRELNEALDRRVAERTAALHLSDTRLRMATDTVGLGIWSWTLADDRWVWENDWPVSIFGTARARWPVTPAQLAACFIDERDRQVFEGLAEHARRHEAPLRFEGRVRGPDGAVRWVELDGDSMTGPGGAVQVLGTLRDTTERRLAEQELRDSERFLRTVTSAARIGLAVIEEARSFRFANEAYAQMLEVPLDAIVGRPVAEVLQAGWPQVRACLDRVFAGERVSFEFTVPAVSAQAEGPVRHFGAFLEPHAGAADEGGEGGGTVVLVVVEITALKQLESELRETDRRKDEFLATLAHELRNPLAPVRNAVQVLNLRGSANREWQRAGEVIDRQMRVMVRLIDDLMDVARINKGRIELHKAQVPLSEVLDWALEASRPQIDEFGHLLVLDLPPEVILLDADLTRLSQAFMNLLTNAVKYTERGGRIELSARVSAEAGQVTVSVKDNGIGIAPAQLEGVFNMFSQVESALVRSRGGLGIGLSLARRLVEMHGGRVEARSKGLGWGSEFLVHLPVLRVEAGRREPALAGVQAASPGDASPAATETALRLLVVDDNQDGADTLSELLSMNGHSVRTAYDGEEALRLAEAFRPHAVLLDIGLPKLNGYETCRYLRAQPWGEGITMIAMTGWGDREAQQAVREAGFNHHFIKPVDENLLMKALAAVDADAAEATEAPGR